MKYYSETLKKVFDTERELKLAEKENESKLAEIQLKKEERAAEAKEVEDAFKVANDAYKIAQEKMNEFVKKHGSYHQTITNSSLPAPTTWFDLFNHFWF